MTTYSLCKKIIENTTYTSQAKKDDMQIKLDAFLLANRLTQDQYNELTIMLANKEIPI